MQDILSSLTAAVGADGVVDPDGQDTLTVVPRDGLRAADLAARLRPDGYLCRVMYYDGSDGAPVWHVVVARRVERTRPPSEYEARILATAARDEVLNGQWAIDDLARRMRESGAYTPERQAQVIAQQKLEPFRRFTLAWAAGIETGSAFTSALRRLVRAGELDSRWIA